MNNYMDMLNDPKWKIKRFEILERDNHKCKKCGSKKKLQVHHIYYSAKFKAPWEYPNECLITLCEHCHKVSHGLAKPKNKKNKRRSKKQIKMRNTIKPTKAMIKKSEEVQKIIDKLKQ